MTDGAFCLFSFVENVMAAFNLLPNHNKTTLQGFVSQYFTGPGEELEKWDPPDFVKLYVYVNMFIHDNFRLQQDCYA